jgi:hypothetical protein
MLDTALTPEREAEHVSAEVLQQHERSSEAHGIRQENLTGRAKSPGHDELRCVLFLINGTVMEDHFREQVASTPLGTVRSS